MDRETYTDLDFCIPDAGIGFEASFQLKTYRFFTFSGKRGTGFERGT